LIVLYSLLIIINGTPFLSTSLDVLIKVKA
jgi:hypothetical protein